MDRAASPAIADRAAVWREGDAGTARPRPGTRSTWNAVRDPIFTVAAVATILACVFGVGPFERPHGSHETFLASPNPR
jgi:hypothetical protein